MWPPFASGDDEVSAGRLERARFCRRRGMASILGAQRGYKDYQVSGSQSLSDADCGLGIHDGYYRDPLVRP